MARVPGHDCDARWHLDPIQLETPHCPPLLPAHTLPRCQGLSWSQGWVVSTQGAESHMGPPALEQRQSPGQVLCELR